MMALTLWPEWATAVAHLGKRCENRDWKPPSYAIGARIAIHAGKFIGGRPGRPAAAEGMDAVWRNAPDEVGTLGLITHHGEPAFALGGRTIPVVTSAIVATVRLVGADLEERTPWDVPGAWHWRLEDVRTLAEPVACRGAQGLWEVPRDIVERVNAARVLGG